MGDDRKINKGLTRRQFLGGVAAASAAATVGICDTTDASIVRYSKLVDTTKCIGCKACMSSCKRWNKLKTYLPHEFQSREQMLSGHTWVSVMYIRSTAKNAEEQGYIHWACQHCGEPACAGVCPVSAIKKYPHGPVVVNENKCVGCRYCYQACPYKIPRFDFEKRVTRKCTLCYNRIPTVQPACVAACPVQALDFGTRVDMIMKAKDRIAEVGGYLLGEKEAGGTDVLTILRGKPSDYGLIVAPQKVVNQKLDKLRISFSGFTAASVLVGLLYVYAQSGKDK